MHIEGCNYFVQALRSVRTRSQQIEQCKQARASKPCDPRAAPSKARGMALQKQAGEFCLACVGHVGGTIDKNYRVRKEAGLDASTAAAVEAAVAPGAAYRAARDAVSAAL